MADITKENNLTDQELESRDPSKGPLVDPTINPASLPSRDEAADAANAPGRKKTAGEMAFDRTVYTGIGLGVNEAGSLIITDLFKDGVGKNLFNRISDWMVKTFKFTQKVAKDGKIITPHHKASNALLTATLLLTGTLLVWPMKALEDSKAYWVKKANHWFDRRGNKLPDEEIAVRDAEVDRAIACQPKQSWPSLLAGRAIAMAAVMANSMYLVKPQGMEKIGNFSESLLTRGKFGMQPVNPGKPKNFWQRQANLLGIETVCCTLSSVVLEITSKLFARGNATPRRPELCAAPPPAANGSAAATDAQERSLPENAARKERKNPENYKKDLILPPKKESYAADELARARETDHSMAP